MDKFVVSTVDVTMRDTSTDQVLAHCTTLMNAAVEQTIQSQNIYGGKGAKKQFQFDYQKEINVNAEDCEWKEEIIAFNNGTLVTNGNATAQKTESITLDGSGEYTLSETPIGKVGLRDSNGTIVNVTASTKDITYAPWAGETVLAIYDYISADTDYITIDADSFGGTFVLIMDADLYLKGTGQVKVGSVQIRIPRFKLSGSYSLPFDMSSAITTTFSGTAMADANNSYATVTIIRDSSSVLAEITDLWLSPDSETLDISDGDTLTLTANGYRGSGKDVIVNPTGVTYESSDETKATVGETTGIVTPVAAGSATITATLTVGTTDLTGTCQITVVA